MTIEDMAPTVESARTAADDGRLAAWVADFLASPGSDNPELADQLLDEKRCWVGPVCLPLDQLHRLAGPPGEKVLGRLGEDDLETVEAMVASMEDGWEPPPVIVSLNGDQLVVEDGNHRVEALRRRGADGWWSVVGCADADERARVLERWATERARGELTQ